MNNVTHLQSINRFKSQDLDLIRENLTRIFTPHSLTPATSRCRLNLDVWERGFGASSLVSVKYGAKVVVEADALNQWYLFQIPTGEPIEVISSASNKRCSQRHLSVVSPTYPFSMKWSKGSSTLALKISRFKVENLLSELLGEPIDDPVMFSPVVDLKSPEGISWLNLIEFLKQQLVFNIGFTSQQTLQSIEDMAVKCALQTFKHNYTAQLEGNHCEIQPKIIQRAKDYVNDNLEENIEVSDLLSNCGTSYSTLSKYFKQYLNLSPSEYIRLVKLEAAHKTLSQADLSMQVTDVAIQYGFSHFGRFSGYYKKRFGETPSTTLRRLRK